jgi:hypothetical protein
VNQPFACALASRGFNVLSLPYFGEKGLPAELVGVPLEYFEKAFSWLQNNSLPQSKENLPYGDVERRGSGDDPRLTVPVHHQGGRHRAARVLLSGDLLHEVQFLMDVSGKTVAVYPFEGPLASGRYAPL